MVVMMGVIVTACQDVCVVMIGYPSKFDGKNLTSIFVKFPAEPDFTTVPYLWV